MGYLGSGVGGVGREEGSRCGAHFEGAGCWRIVCGTGAETMPMRVGNTRVLAILSKARWWCWRGPWQAISGDETTSLCECQNGILQRDVSDVTISQAV